MKKKILFGFAAVAIAALTIVACKRGFDKFDARGTDAGPVIVDTCTPVSCVSNVCNITPATLIDTVPRIISTGVNFTLTNNKIWILPYKCYVDSAAQLIVNPGTIIKAIKRTSNDSAAAIIVTRWGRINANGSATCPIIFTSNQTTPTTGDWGGIVLLGRAPVNKVNPTIEGINLPSVPAGIDVNYGGNVSNDNSGILRYVRIEYAGAAIATDNELNGLTCGGVGSGTTLSYIQVYKGNDDAFEFFGGTVNADHLYAYVPDDDAFDFDLGYVGRIQFAVSVLNATDDFSPNPNGIECDNDATGSSDQPYTYPKLSNLTVIGVCDSATSKKLGDVLLNGAQFRRNTRLTVFNSIFMGFPTGVDFTGSQIADTSCFRYNLVQAFDTKYKPTTFSHINTNQEFRTGTSANDSIQLVAPCNYSCPDFRPKVGSYPSSGANFTDGCVSTLGFTSVTYRGAFAACNTTNANWLAGWTKH
ncbi:hypothetical protein [Paraflavitalea pollutisoli]|uniref:hypothetical protein n=1 Tax=Paraflavitalea pollutisoli TaxID=3034143 RepID=UPI0023ECC447|nr:hypothetical protein [Paraflavitalea sp. H1-2-19X]